jgi:hypothetical protein
LSVAIGDQWRIAYAQKVRDAMGPDLCAVADALRVTFGAKLSWLETDGLTVGTEPDWGVPTQWGGIRRSA